MVLHWLVLAHSPPGPPDDELLLEEELLDDELDEPPPATTLAHWSLVLPFLQRQICELVLHFKTDQPACSLPS